MRVASGGAWRPQTLSVGRQVPGRQVHLDTLVVQVPHNRTSALGRGVHRWCTIVSIMLQLLKLLGRLLRLLRWQQRPLELRPLPLPLVHQAFAPQSKLSVPPMPQRLLRWALVAVPTSQWKLRAVRLPRFMQTLKQTRTFEVHLVVEHRPVRWLVRCRAHKMF